MYEAQRLFYEEGVSFDEATAVIAPECLPSNNLCEADLEEAGDMNFEEEASQIEASDEIEASKSNYVFPEMDERTVLLESVYVNPSALY